MARLTYALRSPSVQHYIDDAPAEQKVVALAGRSETQARDVFDHDSEGAWEQMQTFVAEKLEGAR